MRRSVDLEGRVVSRWLRFLCASIPLLAFPLLGCNPKQIWVEVPRFDDGVVDGLWIWRLDESGSYVRHCHLPLGDLAVVRGRESLPYELECDEPQIAFELVASVDRAESDPTTVTLGIWYLIWAEAGSYKLSAYGVDGESALSDTTLEL